MRLFCKHCHSNIDTDIHLMPGLDIKQAMTQPVSGLWYAKCPCCGHLIDFTPPAGDIVVCFADDTKRPESFKDNFDGQDIMRYHVFQTMNEFLLWWIPQTEHWEGMWYYVFDKGVQICSGAVDPYDIDIWRKHFGVKVVNQALNDCIKAGVRFNEPNAAQTNPPDAPEPINEKGEQPMCNNSHGIVIKRNFNGLELTIELTHDEADAIYQNIRNQKRLQDARRYLLDAIYDGIAADASAEQRIVDTYGCSADDMCDASSPHYALAYLVSRFVEMADEDTADTETWHGIITDYLSFCKTGKQEADKATAPSESKTMPDEKPSTRCDAGKETAHTANASKKLVLLTCSDSSKTLYLEFNRPLNRAAFLAFETCLTRELNLFSNTGRSLTDNLKDVITNVCIRFFKTPAAKAYGLTSADIYKNAPDDAPFWKKTVFVNKANENSLKVSQNIVCLTDTDTKERVYIVFNRGLISWDFQVLNNYVDIFIRAAELQQKRNEPVETPDMKRFATAVAQNFMRSKQANRNGIRSFHVTDTLPDAAPHWERDVTLHYTKSEV